MTEHPHGTLTRATNGRCRCIECRAAKTRYDKRWAYLRSQGVEFVVDAAPSVRKLGALRALGHTNIVLAEKLGVTRQTSTGYLAQKRIKAATAWKIEQVYRELEMVIPPDTTGTRATKAKARRRGFHPPLAWEDIDAGILAEPEKIRWDHERYDEELIDYVLQYRDFSIRLSKRERFEVTRRWTRSIGPERDLCALTGWREGRYAAKNNPYITHHQEAS